MDDTIVLDANDPSFYGTRREEVVEEEEPDFMEEYWLETYYAVATVENAAYAADDLEDYDFNPRAKPQQNIAFLSGAHRKVLPMSKEAAMQVPPNQYDIPYTRGLYNRLISQRGVGGLAKQAPRFAEEKLEVSPGPGQYLPSKYLAKPPQGKKYPFNVGAPRFKSKFNKIPGVGTHEINVKLNRGAEFMHCFNFKKYLVPVVEIKCVPLNEDLCNRCEKPPVGDYWVYDCTEFLCRRCMEQLRNKKKKKLNEKLDHFKKIRDCSFMHDHEGTTAKIHLWEDKKVLKMQAKEAYLSQYFK